MFPLLLNPTSRSSLERPIGVSILAACYLFSGVAWAMYGVLAHTSPRIVGLTPSNDSTGDTLVGVLSFVFSSLLLVATGIGLWTLNNWARRMAMTLAGIAAFYMVTVVVLFPSSGRWVVALGSALVLAYLLRPQVRTVFSLKVEAPGQLEEAETMRAVDRDIMMTNRDYSKEWQEYRRSRNLSIISTIAFFPWVALWGGLAYGLFGDDEAVADAVFLVAGVVGAVVVIILGNRCTLFRCPRCRKRFFSGGFIFWSKCHHCGLRKFSNT